MGKNKLKKFAQNEQFEHVIQPDFKNVFRKDHALKGNWDETFGNNNPITLELACGKGEYAVGQARLFPERNFIGIDVKGARMFTGAKEVDEEGLENVRFLRTKIDLINSFFAEGEVDEIWITFADPQMQKPRKRLTSDLFLDRYIQLLKPGGTLNLKCDSVDLYEFTRDESIPEFNALANGFRFEQRFNTEQLYEEGIHRLDETMQKVLNIRTYYEQMWLEEGRKIKYLRYELMKQ